MPLDLTKIQNSVSNYLLSHQVNNKPNFAYLSPLKITDQSFPEDIPPSYPLKSAPNLASSASTCTHSADSSETYEIFRQYSTDDIDKMKPMDRLKFNKAIFVKIKNKNYIKNYKIVVNCIGKGAFSTVRKVQSHISKEFRAAKCIKNKNSKKQDLQKHLIEVYIMMELDHPNIANILEVYDYKNQFTLICELCEGNDLSTYSKNVNRHKKQEKFVGFLMKQLLRTVMYLHNKGIVHRDIKLQNILFENQDSQNIKLIDFGIASKIAPNQLLTARVGTPAYMAPEIITQSYNQKVDVWAVGVTMYYLLSGQLPFLGDTMKQIMHQIIMSEPKFSEYAWKTISPDCIEVIKLMLRKNYPDRPSAKEIFNHPFFRKIEDQDLPEHQKAEFAQNIRKFQFKNKLQAAIQTFIASQLLSAEEKNQLVNFFRDFDQNSDGVISIHELKQGLEMRKKISTQRIEELMNIIDTNGSGYIDYTEFLAAGFIDAKSFTVERLKQAFAYFDTNGNGRISFEEVSEFMKEFGENVEEIQSLFQDFDTNGDGSITEDEFVSLMLEKSKHLDLGKMKECLKEDEFQKRLGPMELNKLCFDFMFPISKSQKKVNSGNNSFMFAQSLPPPNFKKAKSKSQLDRYL